MRGEPAQPKSEPVKELTELTANTGKPIKSGAYHREMALQIAIGIPRSNPTVTQLLTDAKAIELYLKGEQ